MPIGRPHDFHPPRIGIDFDNTIACYDGAFHAAAIERRLITGQVAGTKGAIRDYLRGLDREDDWTALQGYVYGARMSLASPFPGFVSFLERAAQQGSEVWIISHKTLRPYRGPGYDLHAAARGFLREQGISGRLVPEHRVHFELTIEAKFQRIARLECTHFIDDLPEVLTDARFPEGVVKLLFDPSNHHSPHPGYVHFCDWHELGQRLLN